MCCSLNTNTIFITQGVSSLGHGRLCDIVKKQRRVHYKRFSRIMSESINPSKNIRVSIIGYQQTSHKQNYDDDDNNHYRIWIDYDPQDIII
jgi:hypothetical protein